MVEQASDLEQALNSLEGFQLVSGEPKRRLIVTVDGEEKTGKTHFALTAPGPIALINLDIGDEGVAEKFVVEGKKIAKNDYLLPHGRTASQEDAIALWEKLKSDYYKALENSVIRSIVIDTGTDAWALDRLARFGQLSKVPAYKYDEINVEFKEMIKRAYAHDKNVILTHQLKDEYVDNQRTGGRIRSGFSKIGYLSQVTVRTVRYFGDEFSLNSPRTTLDPTAKAKFGIVVTDCRQNRSAINLHLPDGVASFPVVGQAIFPLKDGEPNPWV